MSTAAYAGISKRKTAQTKAIPGETQVRNNAGGFVYELDKWKAFERFLILGTEGGTYYVKEQPLTEKASANVLACIAEDGKRAVDLIVAISDGGRAPKNTPAEFALALGASAKDEGTRAYALAALPKVCRIGTHLFHFVDFTLKQRGVSRMLRRELAAWYTSKSPEDLAYELVKYQSRDGWAHRDVLRQAHPKTDDPDKQAALRWAVGAKTMFGRDITRKIGKGERVDHYAAPTHWAEGVQAHPDIIAAFEVAKTADTKQLVKLIREAGLTREMIPTEALTKAEVWEALLEKMPPHALLRNLGNLSKVGLLTPMSDASKLVVQKLGADTDYLRKKRVHPVAVLVALKVYAQGRSIKGDGTWTPVPAVVNALDDMFYRAFGAIEPTGKRFLYGLDISGSMSSPCGGTPLSCAEGAAAMALACVKSEQDYYVMGFANTFKDLGITPKMRLDDVLQRTRNQNFGSTDCSLPMTWALKHKVKADCFVVITDSETYAGAIHPSQALRAYRQQMGIPAKEVVIGMTATEFSIADPNDPGTLDVCGFDANTPQAVSEFAR